MIAIARTKAGWSPPTKSAATDRLAMDPMTIMRMQGGTRIPIADAAATTLTACSGLYPARVRGGVMAAAMADTAAMVEPGIAAKMYAVAAAAMAGAPRTAPTQARAERPTANAVA